jgi:ADP-heptose:LPS heptosyltransferase
MATLDLLTAAAASWPLRLRRLLARPARRPLKRVLVLGYGAIGDTVFFLPVVEALRRGAPEARIVWLANRSPVADELVPATGLADEVWHWDFAGTDADRSHEIVRRIREADFDAAVLSMSSPAPYFAQALAGIPIVAAHRFEGGAFKRRLIMGAPSRAALGADAALTLGADHSVTRNLRLLDALVLKCDPATRPGLGVAASQRARAAELLTGGAGPWVGVHVGPPTSYNFRAWAPERFGELCARLAADWPGARFALIGGPDEKSTAARALKSGPAGMLDLTGRSSLIESFALVERCALLLAGDTGLAKAGMAVGTPTVTLWGPSSFTESGAFWEKEKHLDLATGISCAPCSFSGMPRDGRLNYLDCGHHDCLVAMSAAWVRERVLQRWPRLGKS